MPPLTRMRASQPADLATDVNVEYYRQRATKGGLIITEATQVSMQGKGYPCTPGIHTNEQITAWRSVVEAIHERGGVVFAQLWHTGRISHSSHRPDGFLPVSPSDVRPAGNAFGAEFKPYPYEPPRALSLGEIAEVVEDYQQAAVNALEAGFDGVEIHAANGYLIDQFLQDRTNHRSDRYGGSYSNRARFLLDVTDVIVSVWGTKRVGVRLSPFGTANDIGDSNPEPLFRHAIEALSERQIGYLHLIEPRFQPAMRDDINAEAPSSIGEIFRYSFAGPLILAGGFTRASAEETLNRGIADAIAFGRLFIANPDLPQRLAMNTELNHYDRSTFYGGGKTGYTDYPALQIDSAQAVDVIS